MAHLIDKDAVIAMIDKFMYGANLEADIASIGECFNEEVANAKYELCKQIKDSIDTFEVIDPYEKCIQYSTVKDGIEAHAEVYSFNIESELFPQLTKEQQALWRKEIEQACISGGNVGVGLAKDVRYKENFEVKEVDLEKEIPMWIKENPRERSFDDGWFIGMDDCLHRNGYKIKICDLWNLPKEPFNSKEFETI